MKRLTIFAALLLAQALALAGDWSLPLTTSTYTNFVTEVKNRDVDLALGFDPAHTTPTNISTNTIRWSSAAGKWQKWDGTAWVDLASLYNLNSVALTGGATNGVPYLNSSKVLTTGGALTFDGNNRLSVGTAVGSFLVELTSSEILAGSDTGGFYFASGNGVNPAKPIYFGNSGTTLNLQKVATAGYHAWNFGTTEGARLNSTGLGIGTSTPSYKLHIADPSAAYIGAVQTANGVNTVFGSASSVGLLGTTTNHPIDFYVNNAARARIDTAGNFGLGVTPAAWNADYRAMQLGANASITGRVGASNELNVVSNAYRDNIAGDWRYLATAPASRYVVDGSSGSHLWYTVPSGLAGATLTWTQAMLLDSAGTLTATLNTATTGATQAQNDNSNKVATTAYADRPASETAAGRVELATAAETITGTDTTRATHPAGVKAAIDAYGLTLMTPQATTSGTEKTFTGIPSWVKRITILLDGVSTAANTNLIVQLGTSGGIDATGYTSLALTMDYQNTAFTTGFGLTGSADASLPLKGMVTLVRFSTSSDTWVLSSSGSIVSTFMLGSGTKSLSGTLDRVRLTTPGGTDTFDAGSVNVMYE